jgi:hypothetical protein
VINIGIGQQTEELLQQVDIGEKFIDYRWNLARKKLAAYEGVFKAALV